MTTLQEKINETKKQIKERYEMIESTRKQNRLVYSSSNSLYGSAGFDIDGKHEIEEMKEKARELEKKLEQLELQAQAEQSPKSQKDFATSSLSKEEKAEKEAELIERINKLSMKTEEEIRAEEETELDKALSLWLRISKQHEEYNNRSYGYSKCKSDACAYGAGDPCPKHKFIVGNQRELEGVLYQRVKELLWGNQQEAQVEVPPKK